MHEVKHLLVRISTCMPVIFQHVSVLMFRSMKEYHFQIHRRFGTSSISEQVASTFYTAGGQTTDSNNNIT
jgi:hypothetical protein